MGRQITEKTIKEHHECVCGKNTVEDYPLKIKTSDLKYIGCKRRIFKDSGQWYWFRYIYYDECHCNDEE